MGLQLKMHMAVREVKRSHACGSLRTQQPQELKCRGLVYAQTVYRIQHPKKYMNKNKYQTPRPAKILGNFWSDRKNVYANRVCKLSVEDE